MAGSLKQFISPVWTEVLCETWSTLHFLCQVDHNDFALITFFFSRLFNHSVLSFYTFGDEDEMFEQIKQTSNKSQCMKCNKTNNFTMNYFSEQKTMMKENSIILR